ncbi:MAG: hypothetical protein JW841_06660 [Deltaproteobacteria bacterium]|nr:hypothetical protein [Deltaproteobacteria bacterium]
MRIAHGLQRSLGLDFYSQPRDPLWPKGSKQELQTAREAQAWAELAAVLQAWRADSNEVTVGRVLNVLRAYADVFAVTIATMASETEANGSQTDVLGTTNTNTNSNTNSNSNTNAIARSPTTTNVPALPQSTTLMQIAPRPQPKALPPPIVSPVTPFISLPDDDVIHEGYYEPTTPEEIPDENTLTASRYLTELQRFLESLSTTTSEANTHINDGTNYLIGNNECEEYTKELERIYYEFYKIRPYLVEAANVGNSLARQIILDFIHAYTEIRNAVAILSMQRQALALNELIANGRGLIESYTSQTGDPPATLEDIAQNGTEVETAITTLQIDIDNYTSIVEFTSEDYPDKQRQLIDSINRVIKRSKEHTARIDHYISQSGQQISISTNKKQNSTTNNTISLPISLTITLNKLTNYTNTLINNCTAAANQLETIKNYANRETIDSNIGQHDFPRRIGQAQTCLNYAKLVRDEFEKNYGHKVTNADPAFKLITLLNAARDNLDKARQKAQYINTVHNRLKAIKHDTAVLITSTDIAFTNIIKATAQTAQGKLQNVSNKQIKSKLSAISQGCNVIDRDATKFIIGKLIHLEKLCSSIEASPQSRYINYQLAMLKRDYTRTKNMMARYGINEDTQNTSSSIINTLALRLNIITERIDKLLNPPQQP